MSVTRRRFVQTMSGLLVVPLLRFQPAEIDRHKLLGLFVGGEHDSSIYKLHIPYVVGENAYASDGRIMARTWTNDDETDSEVIRIPPFERTWTYHFSQSHEDWRPFRLFDIQDLAPTQNAVCPLCDDRRVELDHFPADWTKELDEVDYDPSDNTVRDASCSLCHGREHIGPSLQPIGDRHIGYEYAKKIAQVPGVEVCLSGRHTEPILFRSEAGILGMVMPRRQVWRHP